MYLSLRMVHGNPSPEVTGSFFAEFLEDSSLDHLRVLPQSTCVGLRYGLVWLSLRVFSCNLKILKSPISRQSLRHSLINHLGGFSSQDYLRAYAPKSY